MKRRKFIRNSGSTALLAGLSSTLVAGGKEVNQSHINDINIIGPKEGYTPQMGTLVSMMNWMREVILRPVHGLSTKDLDYVHDEDSNSIGAMLWHLAATERFYQRNTMNGKQWDGLSASDSIKWQAASSLGNQGRSTIKGYALDFYLELLENVREFTLDEFRNLDDEWLMEVDHNFWSSGTNNYCKWFHVCEHESNHNGQIKYIKKRLS